jgi:hypothetical protein
VLYQKNDFTVLTETIGINSLFEIPDNLDFLHQLLSNINQDGYLIINFGNHNSFIERFDDQIEEIFESHIVLRKIYYGNFNKIMKIISNH